MAGRGLVEHSDSNNKVFLVVKHFSICQESKNPREGFEAIKVTNPKSKEETTKYIKRYDTVEGTICKIEWHDTGDKYDERYMSWKIHLDANGTPCVLELPFESKVSSRFMKVAENIDYTQLVAFRAWYDAKADGTAFYVGQNEKSVAQAYTRENPGNCPEPTKSTVAGKVKWNFDSQKEFLYRRMMEVVLPRVEKCSNVMPGGFTADTANNTAPEKTQEEIDDDSIPF